MIGRINSAAQIGRLNRVARRKEAEGDWWLAQYRFALPAPLYTPEYPSPPNLPAGVSGWLIHQTAERYNGSAVGVVSRYVDSNRWNGSVLDVLRCFGMDNVEPEPEVPPELSDKEKLDKLWNAHKELW